MVTSWNWLLLTDFASFKPTYLPEVSAAFIKTGPGVTSLVARPPKKGGMKFLLIFK